MTEKRAKYGGRQSIDGEPRKKTIAVRESTKPQVERFRDLLDNPLITEIAINALQDLEEIAKRDKYVLD